MHLHRALVDEAVVAGVDNANLVGGQLLRDDGGGDFGQRGPPAEDGRALPVLPLHPAEIGVGVGLPVQQRADESGLAMGFQEGGPPRKVAFVAHRGEGDGTECLAARAARSVARINLDVVGQGQERPLQ